VIALDRRDISFGATPTDTIDSPFDTEPGNVGLQWENDNRSTWKQTGVFVTSDIDAGDAEPGAGRPLGRLQRQARTPASSATSDRRQEGRQGNKATYTASLTYKLPIGLMPYISYAKASALEMSQAGDVAPNLVADGSWLSSSDLTEAGVKFQLAARDPGRLAGGLQAEPHPDRRRHRRPPYRARAPRASSWRSAGWPERCPSPSPATASAPRSRGRMRRSSTSRPTPPASRARRAMAAPTWSGLRQPAGPRGDYAYTLIPKSVVSLYGTYTSKGYDWGQAGATVGRQPCQPHRGHRAERRAYPAYSLVNASAFVNRGPYTLSVNIDNLFDKLYFTPDADSYANLGALPSKGREWRATLKRTF
jgi:iron complex outermembrane receptor protein